MRVLRVSHSAVVDLWRERERALRRLGHDVEVVSATRWREGGRLVSLRLRAGEHATGARTVGRHPALFLYDPRPLWRALGGLLDVVDIHEEPFALATAEVLLLRLLRRQRAPYVLYSAQNIDKRYPPPFRWLERWALRHAGGVSVCNDAAGRIAEHKGFPGRARTIDLGTDLRTFTPGSASTPGQSRDPGKVVVGYGGRLDAAKGVDVLLHALALDDGLSARIAGDGPERARLGALARELAVQGRVEMLGALDAETLPDFFRSVDVVAVPSLTTASWVEQFGRVALEAMACGVPVVTSDSGALPGVVGDAAIVVPEGDPGALAAALSDAGRDADVASRLRRAGLERARSSSWEEVARSYEQLYLAATRTPRSPGPGERPLEIVVVAYGQPDLLAEALEPLTGRRVTVVDNSSSEPVREVASAAGATYVDPGRNGGFAAGVNEGLRHVDPCSDVLLVNPDAVVSSDDVDGLVAALAADSGLASVGPSQVDAHGVPSRVEWPFPSPLGTWLEAVGLGRFRRNRYVIGSVLLLRREAVDHVGLLDDERFFLYSEETDWARRAVRLDWRHALVPGVQVRHVGAATSTDPARRELHFRAGQEVYLRKHHGVLGWQVARAGQVVGSAVRALVLPGARGAAARRRLRVHLAGPARSERRPADWRPLPASRPTATGPARGAGSAAVPVDAASTSTPAGTL